MNPLHEAALAIQQAEEKHPGLGVHLEVDHRFIHVTAHRRNQRYSRVVTWAEVEGGKINVVTATVALVVNRLVGE